MSCNQELKTVNKMRYMFCIYCLSKDQALAVKQSIEKIQIKTILHITINKNESFLDPGKYKYFVNVLCDIRKADYMLEAITRATFVTNITEFYQLKENLYDMYQYTKI